MTAPSVGVIGAGIVGVACAEELRRAGCAVTLIDRSGPAAETSFGNAGLIVANTVTPTQSPGMIAEAVRSLAKGGPFKLDWRRLPQLSPWLIGFLRQGAPDKLAALCEAVAMMTNGAEDAHARLAEGTPAARYLRLGGAWVHLFRALEPTDGFSYRAKRAADIPVRAIYEDELRERDPNLNPAYRSAYELKGAGRVTDPGAYIRALAAYFQAQGGVYRQGEAAALIHEAEGARLTLTDGQELRFDRIVLAAGVWSDALAAQLGLPTRIIAERGYHCEYWGADASPPEDWVYMAADSMHVAHGMDGRLRITSISEPAGLDSPPNPQAQAYVAEGAARLYPNLTYERRTDWMGRRPSTPDSLPLIGPAPKAPNILIAAGHQHIGLTCGPTAARWIADMVLGRRPNQDLSAYRPDRFL